MTKCRCLAPHGLIFPGPFIHIQIIYQKSFFFQTTLYVRTNQTLNNDVMENRKSKTMRNFTAIHQMLLIIDGDWDHELLDGLRPFCRCPQNWGVLLHCLIGATFSDAFIKSLFLSCCKQKKTREMYTQQGKIHERRNKSHPRVNDYCATKTLARCGEGGCNQKRRLKSCSRG